MLNFRARMAGIFKKVTRWWRNTPVEGHLTDPQSRTDQTPTTSLLRKIAATITGLRHCWRIPVVECPVLRQAENRLWQRIGQLEEALGPILDLFFLPRGGEADVIGDEDEEEDALSNALRWIYARPEILLYDYLLPAMKIVAIAVVVVFLFEVFWGGTHSGPVVERQ